jgi:starch synthase (maltosyl-transferring)
VSTQVQTSPAKRRGAAPSKPPPRIVIQYPAPAVDEGRYPAKRCVGDTVQVDADIFRDGHEILRAVVRYKAPRTDEYVETELERIDAHLGGVRWAGSFEVDRQGTWEYTIEAWTDVFGTWRDELERKVAAGQHDLAGELSEGVLLLKTAAKNATEKADKALIQHAVTTLSDDDVPEAAKHDVALGPELFATIERIEPRHGAVTLPSAVPL